MSSSQKTEAIERVVGLLQGADLDSALAAAAAMETEAIERVLGLLQGTDPDSALAAAREVVERFPASPRATYLPVYVQEILVKMMGRGLDKAGILIQGVSTLKLLMKTCHESIVFALYHARLLTLTGNYSAAEVECRKALQIKSPQDPKVHELPMGSISGKDYHERVCSVKKEITMLLKLLSHQAQWGLMTAQTRESLISVKIDTLIKNLSGNQSEGTIISDVLGHYKLSHSWNVYICPLPDCDGYIADAMGLDAHIRLFHLLEPPISAEKAMSDPGLCNVVNLREECDGNDVLCFETFEDVLHCIVSLSSGFMPPSHADLRSKACEKAAATVERLRNEEHKGEESKFLWLKLLEASVIDYRICLLPFLASYMLEEMIKNGNMSAKSAVDFEQYFVGGLELGYKKMEDVNEAAAGSSSLFIDFDFDFSEHDDGKISHSVGEQMLSANAGVLPPYMDLLSSDSYCSSQDQMQSISKAQTDGACLDKQCIEEASSCSLISENLLSIQDLITFDEEIPSVAHVAQSIESLVDLEGKMMKNVNEQEIRQKDINAEKGKEHMVEGKRTELIHPSEMYRPVSKKVALPKQLLFHQLATAQMTPCDPYGNEDLHQKYFMDLKKKEPYHVCSLCYFERNQTKAFKSIFHYQDVHKEWGKPCDFCSARFVSEHGLNKHVEFCHKPSDVSIKKEEKPG